jgi:enoyl-CoA hydratase
MNPIQVEETTGVWILRFAQPEHRNPLSTQTLRALKKHLQEVCRNPGAIGVVLTGSGKVFASGADVRELAAFRPEEAAAYARLGGELLGQIQTFPLPVVAAVNGWALGGALELVLATHLRLAVPDARFGYPALRLGLFPAYQGTVLWMREVLERRLRYVLWTGRTMDAGEAMRLGIIQEITSPARLLAQAVLRVRQASARSRVRTTPNA